MSKSVDKIMVICVHNWIVIPLDCENSPNKIDADGLCYGVECQQPATEEYAVACAKALARVTGADIYKHNKNGDLDLVIFGWRQSRLLELALSLYEDEDVHLTQCAAHSL